MRTSVVNGHMCVPEMNELQSNFSTIKMKILPQMKKNLKQNKFESYILDIADFTTTTFVMGTEIDPMYISRLL